MLIVFLDVCQQPYGWMPSLEMLLSLRIRLKVKWVQNKYITIQYTISNQLLIQIIKQNAIEVLLEY